jgi:hypothetical protein
MTSYLQRLFDRAAGLAGGPATTLSPTFSSRSPLAEADQRLNVPELAASLFALSPFDTPSVSDGEAFADFEEMPARPAPRRAVPPIRTAEAPSRPPPLAEPSIAAPPESPPLPQGLVPSEPRPALPEQPPLDPMPEARQATDAAADTPPHALPSAAPPQVPPPPRERPAPQFAAEPASRAAALEPIPPPPRALPAQLAEPAAVREPTQPRQAETSATPAEPRPMPAAPKTEARVVRALEPVPLPVPEPLPELAPPPRDVAELRQPTVTRPEIVAVAAPEAAAQQPARTMPATAESVSRIGRLTPRRRAPLVFGLRRR